MSLTWPYYQCLYPPTPPYLESTLPKSTPDLFTSSQSQSQPQPRNRTHSSFNRGSLLDLSSTELRDIPLSPSLIVDLNATPNGNGIGNSNGNGNGNGSYGITTIHPQLRDLIVCPQVCGKVYYVKQRGVMEIVMDDGGGRKMEGKVVSVFF